MTDLTVSIEKFTVWLALELAPTILGSKPATILTLSDRSDFSLLTLWRHSGPSLLEKTGLQHLVVRKTDTQETVLFYHYTALQRCFFRSCHKRFFTRCGYCCQNVPDILHELSRRFQYGCPHEIGILLGIPLKDVAGFMEARPTTNTLNAPWKIYGSPEASLRHLRHFNEATCLIKKLLQSYQPEAVLHLAASRQTELKQRVVSTRLIQQAV